MPHRIVRSERFRKLFPALVSELSFVEWSRSLLLPLGFDRRNAIPCVSLCRDELTAPMMASIDQVWCDPESNSKAFVMSSLAGMLLLGRTGMAAAMAHAPLGEDGKERFIFYAFPHIGINERGEVGKLKRHGIAKDSTCCGALCAFHDELKGGKLKNVDVLDPEDVEYSHLRNKLLSKVDLFGKMPDLKDITLMTHEVMLEDLEKLVRGTLEKRPGLADYAIFSGVQVHGPDAINAIAPRTCYAVVDGVRHDFVLDETIAEELGKHEIAKHELLLSTSSVAPSAAAASSSVASFFADVERRRAAHHSTG